MNYSKFWAKQDPTWSWAYQNTVLLSKGLSHTKCIPYGKICALPSFSHASEVLPLKAEYLTFPHWNSWWSLANACLTHDLSRPEPGWDQPVDVGSCLLFHFMCVYFSNWQLYKSVFSPRLDPSIAFIGFVQPASGGVTPMSEIQARWWVEVLKGKVKLPSRHDMEVSVNKEFVSVFLLIMHEMDLMYAVLIWCTCITLQKATRSRWFHSQRHTIQRDPLVYCDEVASFIGAKPEFTKHPSLAWRCDFFLPIVPHGIPHHHNDLLTLWCRLLLGCGGNYQYRLQGPHPWHYAEENVRKVPVTGLMLYGFILGVCLLAYLLFQFVFFILDFVLEEAVDEI